MITAIENGAAVAAPSKIHAAAHQYVKNGWRVIPLVPKSKKPKIKDWPNAKIDTDSVPTSFQDGDNVALLCGQPSGGLVDVDIDHPIAKHFVGLLSQTCMVHGRPGNPVSHYWFRVANPLKVMFLS